MRALCACAIAAVVALVPMAASAQWNTQFVDDSGNAGLSTSIAYDSSGCPHIAYRSATESSLMYAVWNATGGWVLEQVCDPHYQGGCSLVIDEFDTSHLVFEQYGDRLYYITRSAGGVWSSQENVSPDYVPGSGFGYGYIDLAVTYDAFWDTMVPHVAYWYHNDLMYAIRAPETSSWEATCVDDSYSVGSWPSIEVDDEGDVYISYYDAGGTNLKFAYYDGLDWGTFIVDGITTDVGQYSSLVLDSEGRPHVTYYDDTNGRLKHATIDLGLVVAKQQSRRSGAEQASPAPSSAIAR